MTTPLSITVHYCHLCGKVWRWEREFSLDTRDPVRCGECGSVRWNDPEIKAGEALALADGKGGLNG